MCRKSSYFFEELEIALAFARGLEKPNPVCSLA
jgi:hypothetical protein